MCVVKRGSECNEKRREKSKRERGEDRGGAPRPLILAHLTTETRSSGQSLRTHSHTLHASRATLFKNTQTHTRKCNAVEQKTIHLHQYQTSEGSFTCYLDMYVYVRDGDRPSICPLVDTFKKSQMRMVSSWELLMIWNSSNCSRNTRPECSFKHANTHLLYPSQFK